MKKIYAISDQHGTLPSIPPCDLLIVAGDNCLDYPPGAKDRVGTGPQTSRQVSWFHTDWMAWRRKQPAKHCIVTWGNHDYCGEKINAEKPIVALHNTQVVVDGLVEIDGLKIWLTPWSSQFRDWAFMADDWRLLDHYKDVPEGIDILVSHQPPRGYGDGARSYNLSTGEMESLGSKALLETIERVKPAAVVCGHIHSGYGIYDIDICAKHGSNARGCECQQFTQTRVYNVAIVNEQYEHVNPATEIVL